MSKALLLVVVGFAVVGCGPVAEVVKGQAPATSRTAVKQWPGPPSGPEPEPERSVDPLTTDGTWLVPEEIPPGTYRTNLAGGSSMGYSQVCADAACEIGTPGFIDNALYDGPGVLVIPPNAVMVEISNIELTPMASR